MFLFGRIQQLLEGGGDLFRAEAELASKRVKAALVSSAILLASLLVFALGLAVVLAGLTIRIAEGWGWPLALGAVGSALAVVGIGLWLFAIAKSAGADAEEAALPGEMAMDLSTPKQEAEEAKDKMKDAVTPGANKTTEGDSLTDELEGLKQSAVDLAARNPMIVGSAALLAVSLFGPGRTIKLVSRAAAAAGLAASALDAISGDKNADEEDESTNGSDYPPRPRPERVRSHQPRPRGFEGRTPMTPPKRDFRAN